MQRAAIFDMDGTMVDNNAYHLQSWQVLFKRHGRPPVSAQTYQESMSGVPSPVIVRRYFGNGQNEAELIPLIKEKDEIYHRLYRPHIRLINGLAHFLHQLKLAGWKTAIASSAAQHNIDFILDGVDVGRYFDAIINGQHVQEPKPSPQIFLKAAESLGVPPEHCVVFEDSVSGVKAAHAAGMKVVTLTTTHRAGELQPSDLTLDDYHNLTVQQLADLF